RGRVFRASCHRAFQAVFGALSLIEQRLAEGAAIMDLEFLNISDAPPPPPTAAYSHAVRAGDFLFVTGQLGVDPKSGALVPGGATEQAQQIMRNLETLLRGSGPSLARSVML